MTSKVVGATTKATLLSAAIWHMLLAYANAETTVTEQRHVRLFRNGRNQAVRIPVEFELPGDEAIMHRDGERLVIEPVRKRGRVALLKSMNPIDESFPDVADPVPPPERVF
jgi:antitoxin VapB